MTSQKMIAFPTPKELGSYPLRIVVNFNDVPVLRCLKCHTEFIEPATRVKLESLAGSIIDGLKTTLGQSCGSVQHELIELTCSYAT